MSEEIKPNVTRNLYLVIMFCYLFCHIDNGIIAKSNESI